MADWNEHKEHCKVWKKELAKLPAVDQMNLTRAAQPDTAMTVVVKVQFSGSFPMMVYNKGKKINMAADSTTTAAMRIIDAIRENGFVAKDMGKGRCKLPSFDQILIEWSRLLPRALGPSNWSTKCCRQPTRAYATLVIDTQAN
jgi:hypothetical protein